VASSDEDSRSLSLDGAQSNAIRFSVRTLLVVVSGIAIIFGYWTSLPQMLPEWNRLLNRIAAAHDSVAARGMLQGKPAVFSERQEPTRIDYAIGAFALIAFYSAKLLISRCIHHWATQIVAYVMLVSLILPYLYIHWEDWGNPFLFFVGNWLGMPVALLFVPTVTFVFDLLSRPVRSARWLLARSAIEIVVGIPLWGIFWAYFSFFMLGFGWI
jgi:hypothetical protein